MDESANIGLGWAAGLCSFPPYDLRGWKIAAGAVCVHGTEKPTEFASCLLAPVQSSRRGLLVRVWTFRLSRHWPRPAQLGENQQNKTEPGRVRGGESGEGPPPFFEKPLPPQKSLSPRPLFFRVFSTSWGGGRRAGGERGDGLGGMTRPESVLTRGIMGNISQHMDVTCITAWINVVGLPLSRCWNCTLMILLGEI